MCRREEGARLQHLAVGLGDGLGRLLGAGEAHEAEALGLAVAVLHDLLQTKEHILRPLSPTLKSSLHLSLVPSLCCSHECTPAVTMLQSHCCVAVSPFVQPTLAEVMVP